ncbi:hypothetical protein [Agrococcus carbonis]|uniref:Uncharacterized protein n=1 Tax=Agrococcus carbonis TaxID=684552 RepID=A0A1H1PJ01_9MICO|nr:hypothetical protein [Agrococcus carbonis]SDS11057.1 hypothetical protein SAMN04489719_1565 [Agrococcus carbonis]
MTMTDAAAAAALAGAARARAVEEARAASLAVDRARRAAAGAAAAIDLRGAEGWLGPAREAFDARVAALRARLADEEHALRLLGSAIEGAV